MSRKHYIEFADMLLDLQHAAVRHPDEYTAMQAIEDVARRIATIFADDNPRFSRSKFFERAGIGNAN